MQDFSYSFTLALALITDADADLIEIILRSLYVSCSAVLAALIIGLPLGGLLAVVRFPGHHIITIVVNAMMGLPPVVVGLLVYMLISRAGPFGWLDLLYSPTAMIIAQTLLIAPIITALTRQYLEDLHREYDEQLRSFCMPLHRVITVLIWDARYSLITVALAGFGRAVAEVGAVMIVGGNIDHLTRVMTTAIALETSKGNLALALALGIVLLMIALAINASLYSFRMRSTQLAC